MTMRGVKCGVNTGPAFAGRGRGFTLLDVLVSIAVIAILVGLLLPSLAGVRETTRKVVCSSNVRQHGLGLGMFASDHRDDLPQSIFAKATSAQSSPERMNVLRLGEWVNDWDGLGVLHQQDYLPGPGVYYCPSHTGESPLARSAALWSNEGGRIFGNYQYRGAYVIGQVLNLRVLDPFVGLISDGLASVTDFNHKVGANVLNADLAVFWYQDGGTLAKALPSSPDDARAAARVAQAWQLIDQGGTARPPVSPD